MQKPEGIRVKTHTAIYKIRRVIPLRGGVKGEVVSERRSLFSPSKQKAALKLGSDLENPSHCEKNSIILVNLMDVPVFLQA